MNDRPNHAASAIVEQALQLPRSQAGTTMKLAGVKPAVIARVLDKLGRHRATDFRKSGADGHQARRAGDTPK